MEGCPPVGAESRPEAFVKHIRAQQGAVEINSQNVLGNRINLIHETTFSTTLTRDQNVSGYRSTGDLK